MAASPPCPAGDGTPGRKTEPFKASHVLSAHRVQEVPNARMLKSKVLVNTAPAHVHKVENTMGGESKTLTPAKSSSTVLKAQSAKRSENIPVKAKFSGSPGEGVDTGPGGESLHAHHEELSGHVTVHGNDPEPPHVHALASGTTMLQEEEDVRDHSAIEDEEMATAVEGLPLHLADLLEKPRSHMAGEPFMVVRCVEGQVVVVGETEREAGRTHLSVMCDPSLRLVLVAGSLGTPAMAPVSMDLMDMNVRVKGDRVLFRHREIEFEVSSRSKKDLADFVKDVRLMRLDVAVAGNMVLGEAKVGNLRYCKTHSRAAREQWNTHRGIRQIRQWKPEPQEKGQSEEIVAVKEEGKVEIPLAVENGPELMPETLQILAEECEQPNSMSPAKPQTSPVPDLAVISDAPDGQEGQDKEGSGKNSGAAAPCPPLQNTGNALESPVQAQSVVESRGEEEGKHEGGKAPSHSSDDRPIITQAFLHDVQRQRRDLDVEIVSNPPMTPPTRGSPGRNIYRHTHSPDMGYRGNRPNAYQPIYDSPPKSSHRSRGFPAPLPPGSRWRRTSDSARNFDEWGEPYPTFGPGRGHPRLPSREELEMERRTKERSFFMGAENFRRNGYEGGSYSPPCTRSGCGCESSMRRRHPPHADFGGGPYHGPPRNTPQLLDFEPAKFNRRGICNTYDDGQPPYPRSGVHEGGPSSGHAPPNMGGFNNTHDAPVFNDTTNDKLKNGREGEPGPAGGWGVSIRVKNERGESGGGEKKRDGEEEEEKERTKVKPTKKRNKATTGDNGNAETENNGTGVENVGPEVICIESGSEDESGLGGKKQRGERMQTPAGTFGNGDRMQRAYGNGGGSPGLEPPLANYARLVFSPSLYNRGFPNTGCEQNPLGPYQGSPMGRSPPIPRAGGRAPCPCPECVDPRPRNTARRRFSENFTEGKVGIRRDPCDCSACRDQEGGGGMDGGTSWQAQIMQRHHEGNQRGMGGSIPPRGFRESPGPCTKSCCIDDFGRPRRRPHGPHRSMDYESPRRLPPHSGRPGSPQPHGRGRTDYCDCDECNFKRARHGPPPAGVVKGEDYGPARGMPGPHHGRFFPPNPPGDGNLDPRDRGGRFGMGQEGMAPPHLPLDTNENWRSRPRLPVDHPGMGGNGPPLPHAHDDANLRLQSCNCGKVHSVPQHEFMGSPPLGPKIHHPVGNMSAAGSPPPVSVRIYPQVPALDPRRREGPDGMNFRRPGGVNDRPCQDPNCKGGCSRGMGGPM